MKRIGRLGGADNPEPRFGYPFSRFGRRLPPSDETPSGGASTLAFSTTALNDVVFGEVGSTTLEATGGTPPYTYSIVSGAPDGAVIGGDSDDELRTDDVTEGGVFPSVVLRVTDAAMDTADSDPLTLNVFPAAMTILTPAPGDQTWNLRPTVAAAESLESVGADATRFEFTTSDDPTFESIVTSETQAANSATLTSDLSNTPDYLVRVIPKAGTLEGDPSAAVAFNCKLLILLDRFGSGSLAALSGQTRTPDGVGEVAYNNSDGVASISGGRLVLSGSPSDDNFLAPGSGGVAQTVARKGGRTMRVAIPAATSTPGGTGDFALAFYSDPTSETARAAFRMTGAGTLPRFIYNFSSALTTETLSGPPKALALQMCGSGFRWLVQRPDGSVYCAHINFASNDALIPSIFIGDAALGIELDDWYIYDDPDLEADDADASIYQLTPVSGTIYSTAHNQTPHANSNWRGMVTLPGSPSADQVGAELRFRVQDANNHLKVQIKRNAGNTNWDILLFRVTTGAGEVQIGSTVTGIGVAPSIHVWSNGTSIKISTPLSAAAPRPTERFSVTESAFETEVGVSMVAGAGATLGLLACYPIAQALYDEVFSNSFLAPSAGVEPQTWQAADMAELDAALYASAFAPTGSTVFLTGTEAYNGAGVKRTIPNGVTLRSSWEVMGLFEALPPYLDGGTLRGIMTVAPDAIRWNPVSGSNPPAGSKLDSIIIQKPGSTVACCILYDQQTTSIDSHGQGDRLIYQVVAMLCGWNAPDRGHSHGIYGKNLSALLQLHIAETLFGTVWSTSISLRSASSGDVLNTLLEDVVSLTRTILGGGGNVGIVVNRLWLIGGRLDAGYTADAGTVEINDSLFRAGSSHKDLYFSNNVANLVDFLGSGNEFDGFWGYQQAFADRMQGWGGNTWKAPHAPSFTLDGVTHTALAPVQAEGVEVGSTYTETTETADKVAVLPNTLKDDDDPWCGKVCIVVRSGASELEVDVTDLGLATHRVRSGHAEEASKYLFCYYQDFANPDARFEVDTTDEAFPLVTIPLVGYPAKAQSAGSGTPLTHPSTAPQTPGESGYVEFIVIEKGGYSNVLTIDPNHVVSLESGVLTGTADSFDSTSGTGLAVTEAAALAGSTYGLAITIDDTSNRYVVRNIAPLGDQLRYRFYFDPNSIVMGNNESFEMHQVRLDADPWNQFAMSLGYTTANGYHLDAAYNNDGGFGNQDITNLISDAPHYIEVSVTRASSAVAGDGIVAWWIDGVLQTQWTNVDNYDLFPNLAGIWLGPDFGIDAGTSGTIYFDQLVIDYSNTPIGA